MKNENEIRADINLYLERADKSRNLMNESPNEWIFNMHKSDLDFSCARIDALKWVLGE